MRNYNGDSLPSLVRFAAELDCEIRFIELMPFGEGAALYDQEYLSADEALERWRPSLRILALCPGVRPRGGIGS